MLCRYTHHQGKVGHIFLHHGARAHKGMAADGAATHNGSVGANGGTLLHQRAAISIFAHHGCARVVHIGKDHAGAAEHIVLQLDGVVHADVVLDFDVVANAYIIAHKHVLPQRAIAADARAATHMHPVPDARARTDLRPGINNGRGMRRIGRLLPGGLRVYFRHKRSSAG